MNSTHHVQENDTVKDEPMEDKSSTLPVQQMIARHLLDPNTTIPTDNAKLRTAVWPSADDLLLTLTSIPGSSQESSSIGCVPAVHKA